MSVYVQWVIARVVGARVVVSFASAAGLRLDGERSEAVYTIRVVVARC